MSEPPIVSDSGPLIALSGIGRLELLASLHGRVFVPPAVLREVTESGAGRRGAREVAGARWIEVRELVAPPDALLIQELGSGEAEAISLALRLGASVLLDERRGRRIAETVYRLRVRGTVGVLVAAKQRGILPALRPLLEELRRTGYFLSTAIVEQACRAVGE